MTFPSIDADVQPDSGQVSKFHPDSSSNSQYHTVNEISEEARALIATWERNLPCHPPDQLRGVWAHSGIHSVSDLPPPKRYRRVLKKAFIG